MRPGFRPGITPACAGNRLYRCSVSAGKWDHPRLRGEQFAWYLAVWVMAGSPRLRGEQRMLGGRDPQQMGSPPLARGTGPWEWWIPRCCRITPACAGNSPTPHGIGSAKWDHPRLRGEQAELRKGGKMKTGSPPLARGTVAVFAITFPIPRITPACAGNSHANAKITLEI